MKVMAMVFAVAAAPMLAPLPAGAETIESALVLAYQNNPQLNAQRATVRATDETVPQALSGYRPRVNVNSSIGEQYTNQLVSSGGVTMRQEGTTVPRSVGVTATQTLFNGLQTANRTRAAESQVSAAREGLRVLEQTVLLAAATIYMDYLRDSAIVDVQRSNVRVLEETLKQTRDRFNVGEVTRTDVAQSEAQLAAGRSQLSVAESNLNTTRANYRRIIGVDPGRLAAGTPVDRHLPSTLAGAIERSQIENPSVTAAMYGIDVSFLQVKIAEGALFPTVSAMINVQQSYDSSLSVPQMFTALAAAQVTVPIYQGGAEYALIRQSKETLAQQRLVLDLTRDQARASVVQAWGQLQAAKAQVASAQVQVSASETALNGVREEARVGQRTTLDVLNAQQALVNARVALVTAQHDRVVASYNTLTAVGRLSPQVLRLATTVYDPSVHYHQTRDSWFGVRTPDGQ
ncbi:MAG: channel protein TolC [Xanthobacteraceae bacterium]|nr:MAG: channel protein TolC [Xanthobacteraceae bacterium]